MLSNYFMKSKQQKFSNSFFKASTILTPKLHKKATTEKQNYNYYPRQTYMQKSVAKHWPIRVSSKLKIHMS